MIAFNSDLVLLEIKISIELVGGKEKRAVSPASVTLGRECKEMLGG